LHAEVIIAATLGRVGERLKIEKEATDGKPSIYCGKALSEYQV